MGNTSVPDNSPLGVLKNWNNLGEEELKRKLISLCNIIWPQYKSTCRETCPEKWDFIF
jgi:hypothetical protein